MNKKLTFEQKKEIAALYADKSTTVEEIATAYNISQSYASKIAVEMGCERRIKKGKYRNNDVKKCPKCHRTLELIGARFCLFCGTDIRTETDILIERATWLWQIVGIVGENDRDKARDIINELINHLKKEGQK